MEILLGIGCLIIAYIIFKIERHIYGGDSNDYIDKGNQIKAYGLILVIIIVAIAFFIGKIKF